MSIVDSHLHVWDLEAGGYDWLGPQHGELYASFDPRRAEREIRSVGVDRAVLVQAEDSERDTRYLLGIAEHFDFVAGVVGWLRLDDAGTAAAQLAEYGSHPAFRGVRHLVHDDPRDDFLRDHEVRRSLTKLAGLGLPFDVPDAWPRHLAAVAELADAVAELTIVVDHLGKPPRGRDDFGAWRATLREVARRPNTVAKVSGLQVEGQPLTPGALAPVWEVALESFGPSRLMYGGDWPMTVPFGGYAHTWSVLAELAGGLTPDERAQFLCRTADRVYGLGGCDAR